MDPAALCNPDFHPVDLQRIFQEVCTLNATVLLQEILLAEMDAAALVDMVSWNFIHKKNEKVNLKQNKLNVDILVDVVKSCCMKKIVFFVRIPVLQFQF